ncbi:DUF1203 domain-containing protein [Thalassococcus sp. S3]|uniref:DUF1203 domain-containing protein n=1 Tax=Thalassococcus sp. S3 TaxID=2017482 RepID=UPI0010248262|nr:DUF1203 domain-containing protein [Thalassococcus sp. S3]QBF29843.1 hypothetical protein CFI11_01240 [Thalassococcus sp. S3]
MPRFEAMPTNEVEAFRNGAPDANGQPARRGVSPGPGTPCRHCLENIPEGEEMLILAYRPFADLHPYAETGPIFLCAKACARYEETDLPPILKTSPDYLIKGYNDQDSIVYGTGAVVETKAMQDRVAQIFEDPAVKYIHVRSARNNCYQARVDRD